MVSDNESGLRDADGQTSDWIELYNAGSAGVDLTGWTLSDGEGTFTFPALSLGAGGFLLVFAAGDAPAGEAAALRAPFRLNAGGEHLRLMRSDGRVADDVQVPPLGPDESWGRAEPFTTEVLLGPGALARWTTPPPAGFAAPEFDDTAWLEARLPVGWDDEAAQGPGVPENAAFGKPVTQSTDGYGRNGAEAVDGEPATLSHTADGDLEPSLEVALGGAYALSSLTLLNRVDCCAERLYNVEVALLDAEGGVRWASPRLNDVAAGAEPVSPGPRLDVVVDPPVVAHRVRVSKHAQAGSEWLSLSELVATGVPASPYGEFIATRVAGSPLGLRIPFAVDTVPSRLQASVRYDDRVEWWLNGAVRPALGLVGAPHDGGRLESVPVDVRDLRIGENLLALEVSSVDDDDLLLEVTLVADWITVGDLAFFRTPTPGEPNGPGFAALLAAPTVDPPRALAEGALEVTLSGDRPGSTLFYTTDGSPPGPGNGVAIESADVAPIRTLHLDTTTVLRVVAIRAGDAPSPVSTHSYLFLDDVIHQSAAPAGFPALWDGVQENPVAADYEMDPELVGPDPAAMIDALRSLPSLSIVTAPTDLFGPNGLYDNSAERGAAWERPASVEWLLPDGTWGFAERCGVRVHGYGWRAHSVTPKHSLRLEFSRDYGAPALDYPLFPDSPIGHFDSIVLRAGGSKTWLDFRDPAQGQYLHDAFARDTARDMGKVDGHAAFAHLYLNGLYWGLYNLVERPEADFGASYFGGEAEDYDAINRRTVTNEAIDGNLEAYLELLARADAEVSTPEGLAAVEAMLDLDDLIDYMLIHQYTTNRDGPCCFEHNNMRGLRRRAEGEQFRFFVWDMEYSLWDPADATNVDIDVAGSISHVYTRLRENADFRDRFARRAARHLGPGGALSPDAAAARYEARATEIHRALLAESARWGDHNREPPYTRDVEWQVEYNRLMTDYFPRRTALLEAQLRAAGLY